MTSDLSFRLKFAARKISLLQKRYEKLEKKEREQCRKSMEKGNLSLARVHAESAIRLIKQSESFQQLQARLTAICLKVESTEITTAVTSTMKQIVGQLDYALDKDNIEDLHIVMDRFEKQSEEMEAHDQILANVVSSTMSNVTPQEEVDTLLSRIAEEHGMDIRDKLQDPMGLGRPTESRLASKDDLGDRLARLRNIESNTESHAGG